MMQRSLPKPDLHKVIMDSPPASPDEDRDQAPLIQVNDPHLVPQGLDNPAFSPDLPMVEIPAVPTVPAITRSGSTSPGTRATPVSPKTSSRSSPVIRRGSLLPTANNSLFVPEAAGPRRHSLATTCSHEETLASLPSPLGPGTTLNIDYLSTPHSSMNSGPPLSPGGRSMRSNWSELEKLARKDSIGSFHSDEGDGRDYRYSISGISNVMSERIHELVSRFNSRTERFKEKTTQPLTPSTNGSVDTKSAISVVSGAEQDAPDQRRLDSFMPLSRNSGDHEQSKERYIGWGKCKVKVPAILCNLLLGTVDPTGKLYMAWLCAVTFAYLYNATAMTLRAAFITAPFYHKELRNETRLVCDSRTSNASETLTDGYTESYANSDTSTGVYCYNQTVQSQETLYYMGYENDANRLYWWMCDYFCDLLYLLDILVVKSRIRFVKNGIFEHDRKECLKQYMSKTDFKLDVASLFPLDILYLIPSLKYNSMLRWPRLLKIHTFWEFFDRMDQAARSAHLVRVARTLAYMVYLIHIESCGYYYVSAFEGLKRNGWVYQGDGRAYIRCMYLATKTATSIGNNPKPETELEYIFMTLYWLSGVFVFAMLIGQIRDIFQSAGAAKTHYRKTMDQTLSYMQSLNLPSELQGKVRTWFNYNWQHQKTLNENSLLETLPRKMKADLAIHVHFNILSKVQLFQNTDKNLLYDLVLKLNPVLYLPGDYICKKGEVGTEMYIVMQGQVEVVGGPNNSLVFATLYQGSVFGEISLLALAGGNRRTADVRAKGFCNIFILCKADFEEAMRDYPQAQKILKKRAKKLLAQNAKHESKAQAMEGEEIIKSRQGTPKLLKTVVEMVPNKSHIPEMVGMRHRGRHDPHRSGSGQSQDGEHQSPQVDRVDSVSQYSDEHDEILVIEQTEVALPSTGSLKSPTPQQLPGSEEKDQTEPQDSVHVNDTNNQTDGCTAPSPDGTIHAGSSDTVHSGIRSILDSPVKTAEPDSSRIVNKVSDAASVHSASTTASQPSSTNSIAPSTGIGPVLRKNKVEPAVLTFESDAPACHTGASSTSNKAFKKSGPLPSRANRVGVAPPVEKTGDIPAENLVMCSVEIHPVTTSSPGRVPQKDSVSAQNAMRAAGTPTRQDNAPAEAGLAGPSSPHLETTAV